MLTKLIKSHYKSTGKVWPDTWQALGWVITELGEAYELLLAKDPVGWIRNHPGGKEPYSPERYEEELGDVIMMLQVAGMVERLDPLGKLIRRLVGDSSSEDWHKKWDEWHNGIPAPPQDLSDLPLFSEER